MATLWQPFRAGRASDRIPHALLRFVVVGVANTVLSFVVFSAALAALRPARGAAGMAQALAYGAGALLSFALNSRWTFAGAQRTRAAAFRFAVSQAATLLASAGAMELALRVPRLPIPVAWLLVTCGTMLLNFALLRHWVFVRRQSSEMLP
jgi:putative flippase GtrA